MSMDGVEGLVIVGTGVAAAIALLDLTGRYIYRRVAGRTESSEESETQEAESGAETDPESTETDFTSTTEAEASSATDRARSDKKKIPRDKTTHSTGASRHTEEHEHSRSPSPKKENSRRRRKNANRKNKDKVSKEKAEEPDTQSVDESSTSGLDRLQEDFEEQTGSYPLTHHTSSSDKQRKGKGKSSLKGQENFESFAEGDETFKDNIASDKTFTSRSQRQELNFRSSSESVCDSSSDTHKDKTVKREGSQKDRARHKSPPDNPWDTQSKGTSDKVKSDIYSKNSNSELKGAHNIPSQASSHLSPPNTGYYKRDKSPLHKKIPLGAFVTTTEPQGKKRSKQKSNSTQPNASSPLNYNTAKPLNSNALAQQHQLQLNELEPKDSSGTDSTPQDETQHLLRNTSSDSKTAIGGQSKTSKPLADVEEPQEAHVEESTPRTVTQAEPEYSPHLQQTDHKAEEVSLLPGDVIQQDDIPLSDGQLSGLSANQDTHYKLDQKTPQIAVSTSDPAQHSEPRRDKDAAKEQNMLHAENTSETLTKTTSSLVSSEGTYSKSLSSEEETNNFGQDIFESRSGYSAEEAELINLDSPNFKKQSRKKAAKIKATENQIFVQSKATFDDSELSDPGMLGTMPSEQILNLTEDSNMFQKDTEDADADSALGESMIADISTLSETNVAEEKYPSYLVEELSTDLHQGNELTRLEYEQYPGHLALQTSLSLDGYKPQSTSFTGSMDHGEQSLNAVDEKCSLYEDVELSGYEDVVPSAHHSDPEEGEDESSATKDAGREVETPSEDKPSLDNEEIPSKDEISSSNVLDFSDSLKSSEDNYASRIEDVELSSPDHEISTGAEDIKVYSLEHSHRSDVEDVLATAVDVKPTENISMPRIDDVESDVLEEMKPEDAEDTKPKTKPQDTDGQITSGSEDDESAYTEETQLSADETSLQTDDIDTPHTTSKYKYEDSEEDTTNETTKESADRQERKFYQDSLLVGESPIVTSQKTKSDLEASPSGQEPHSTETLSSSRLETQHEEQSLNSSKDDVHDSCSEEDYFSQSSETDNDNKDPILYTGKDSKPEGNSGSSSTNTPTHLTPQKKVDQAIVGSDEDTTICSAAQAPIGESDEETEIGSVAEIPVEQTDDDTKIHSVVETTSSVQNLPATDKQGDLSPNSDDTHRTNDGAEDVESLNSSSEIDDTNRKIFESSALSSAHPEESSTSECVESHPKDISTNSAEYKSQNSPNVKEEEPIIDSNDAEIKESVTTVGRTENVLHSTETSPFTVTVMDDNGNPQQSPYMSDEEISPETDVPKKIPIIMLQQPSIEEPRVKSEDVYIVDEYSPSLSDASSYDGEVVIEEMTAEHHETDISTEETQSEIANYQSVEDDSISDSIDEAITVLGEMKDIMHSAESSEYSVNDNVDVSPANQEGGADQISSITETKKIPTIILQEPSLDESCVTSEDMYIVDEYTSSQSETSTNDDGEHTTEESTTAVTETDIPKDDICHESSMHDEDDGSSVDKDHTLLEDTIKESVITSEYVSDEICKPKTTSENPSQSNEHYTTETQKKIPVIILQEASVDESLAPSEDIHTVEEYTSSQSETSTNDDGEHTTEEFTTVVNEMDIPNEETCHGSLMPDEDDGSSTDKDNTLLEKESGVISEDVSSENPPQSNEHYTTETPTKVPVIILQEASVDESISTPEDIHIVEEYTSSQSETNVDGEQTTDAFTTAVTGMDIPKEETCHESSMPEEVDVSTIGEDRVLLENTVDESVFTSNDVADEKSKAQATTKMSENDTDEDYVTSSTSNQAHTSPVDETDHQTLMKEEKDSSYEKIEESDCCSDSSEDTFEDSFEHIPNESIEELEYITGPSDEPSVSQEPEFQDSAGKTSSFIDEEKPMVADADRVDAVEDETYQQDIVNKTLSDDFSDNQETPKKDTYTPKSEDTPDQVENTFLHVYDQKDKSLNDHDESDGSCVDPIDFSDMKIDSQPNTTHKESSEIDNQTSTGKIFKVVEDIQTQLDSVMSPELISEQTPSTKETKTPALREKECKSKANAETLLSDQANDDITSHSAIGETEPHASKDEPQSVIGNIFQVVKGIATGIESITSKAKPDGGHKRKDLNRNHAEPETFTDSSAYSSDIENGTPNQDHSDSQETLEKAEFEPTKTETPVQPSTPTAPLITNAKSMPLSVTQESTTIIPSDDAHQTTQHSTKEEAIPEQLESQSAALHIDESQESQEALIKDSGRSSVTLVEGTPDRLQEAERLHSEPFSEVKDQAVEVTVPQMSKERTESESSSESFTIAPEEMFSDDANAASLKDATSDSFINGYVSVSNKKVTENQIVTETVPNVHIELSSGTSHLEDPRTWANAERPTSPSIINSKEKDADEHLSPSLTKSESDEESLTAKSRQAPANSTEYAVSDGWPTSSSSDKADGLSTTTSRGDSHTSRTFNSPDDTRESLDDSNQQVELNQQNAPEDLTLETSQESEQYQITEAESPSTTEAHSPPAPTFELSVEDILQFQEQRKLSDIREDPGESLTRDDEDEMASHRYHAAVNFKRPKVTLAQAMGRSQGSVDDAFQQDPPKNSTAANSQESQDVPVINSNAVPSGTAEGKSKRTRTKSSTERALERAGLMQDPEDNFGFTIRRQSTSRQESTDSRDGELLQEVQEAIDARNRVTTTTVESSPGRAPLARSETITTTREIVQEPTIVKQVSVDRPRSRLPPALGSTRTSSFQTSKQESVDGVFERQPNDETVQRTTTTTTYLTNVPKQPSVDQSRNDAEDLSTTKTETITESVPSPRSGYTIERKVTRTINTDNPLENVQQNSTQYATREAPKEDITDTDQQKKPESGFLSLKDVLFGKKSNQTGPKESPKEVINEIYAKEIPTQVITKTYEIRTPDSRSGLRSFPGSGKRSSTQFTTRVSSVNDDTQAAEAPSDSQNEPRAEVTTVSASSESSKPVLKPFPSYEQKSFSQYTTRESPKQDITEANTQEKTTSGSQSLDDEPKLVQDKSGLKPFPGSSTKFTTRESPRQEVTETYTRETTKPEYQNSKAESEQIPDASDSSNLRPGLKQFPGSSTQFTTRESPRREVTETYTRETTQPEYQNSNAESKSVPDASDSTSQRPALKPFLSYEKKSSTQFTTRESPTRQVVTETYSNETKPAEPQSVRARPIPIVKSTTQYTTRETPRQVVTETYTQEVPSPDAPNLKGVVKGIPGFEKRPLNRRPDKPAASQGAINILRGKRSKRGGSASGLAELDKVTKMDESGGYTLRRNTGLHKGSTESIPLVREKDIISQDLKDLKDLKTLEMNDLAEALDDFDDTSTEVDYDTEEILEDLAEAVRTNVKISSEVNLEIFPRGFRQKIEGIRNIGNSFEALSDEITRKALELLDREDSEEDVPADSEDKPSDPLAEVLKRRAYLRAQWLGLRRLLFCVDLQLRHAAGYHLYFEDVRALKRLMLDFHKMLQQEEIEDAAAEEDETYTDENPKPVDLDELRKTAAHFQNLRTNVQDVVKRSSKIVPMRKRQDPLVDPLSIQCVCAITSDKFDLDEGEPLTLIDNSAPYKWRVQNSDGQEDELSSAYCVIPPPDPDAVLAAAQLDEALSALMDRYIETMRRRLLRYSKGVLGPILDKADPLLKQLTTETKRDLVNDLTNLDEACEDLFSGMTGYPRLDEIEEGLVSAVKKARLGLTEDPRVEGEVAEPIEDLYAMLGELQNMVKKREAAKAFAMKYGLSKYLDDDNLDWVVELLENPERGVAISVRHQETEVMETTTFTSTTGEVRQTFSIGSVYDPRYGQHLSMEEAIRLGILDHIQGFYVHPLSREPIPIPAAMNAGLIMVEGTQTKLIHGPTKECGLVTVSVTRENRPYTIKRVRDPDSHEELNVVEAIERGIFDASRGMWLNPASNEEINAKNAIDSGLLIVEYDKDAENVPEVIKRTFAVYALMDRRLGKRIPFDEASERGIVDKEKGIYTDNISGLTMHVIEAAKQGYVKMRVIESIVRLERFVSRDRSDSLDSMASGSSIGSYGSF